MLLKIGTPADYAPFSFKNPLTNEFIGFEIDLIKQIAADLNYEYELIKTNWFDLDNDLDSNIFDLAIGGISLTDTRKQKFLTSIPIMEDAKTILTSIKHPENISSLNDVDKRQFIIITNRGGTNEIFVKNNIKHAQIKIVDDNDSIFDKIATGEADFMFTDLSEALYREAINPLLKVAKPITLYTKHISYGFLYNKKNLALKNMIDVYLTKFIQSREFKALYNKFFAKSDIS